MVIAKASCVYNSRIIYLFRALSLIFFFFASHSFLASGMPFPIVSRIVVNVSWPTCSQRIRLGCKFFCLHGHVMAVYLVYHVRYLVRSINVLSLLWVYGEEVHWSFE